MLRQELEDTFERLILRKMEGRVAPEKIVSLQKLFLEMVQDAVNFDPGVTILPKASGPSVKCEYKMRVVTVPRDGRRPAHLHDNE